MFDILTLAALPTVALGATIAAVVIVCYSSRRRPSGPRPAALADTRTLMQKWEDPDWAGSMDVAAERRHRAQVAQLRPPASYRPPVAAPLTVHCLSCGARDDAPHYPGCPLGDAECASVRAALLSGNYDELLAAVDAEPPAALPELPPAVAARGLDPGAWRPYLTDQEFSAVFPGVPDAPPCPECQGRLLFAVGLHCPACGWAEPVTGNMDAVTPAVADQLAQLDAEVNDYMAQRAAAHAALRSSLIAAWRAIGQTRAGDTR